MTTENIPLSKLKISDFNVRKDVGDISELVESVKEKGVFQPILVRPENGKYGIIVGSRRYSAAKEAKLYDIPATVKQMDDEEALVISLSENIQRNDLQPKETAETLAKLMERNTSRDIAKKIGKTQAYVNYMVSSAQLLGILEKHGVKVSNQAPDSERSLGKAIPTFHAVSLAQAINKIGDVPETKQVELARAVAPKTREDTERVAKYFEKHPEKSVDTIVERALYPSLGDITDGRIDSGMDNGIVDITPPVGREINSKLIWNLERIDTQYDFYTIGYGYSETDEFIKRLKVKGIKTLIDVRNNATGSIYKPEYNQENLERSLKKEGIRYIHLPELGVPKEHRSELNTDEDYQRLWKWYDKNVVTLDVGNGEAEDYEGQPALEWSFKHKELTDWVHPVAFMCRELDPTKCHRHRISRFLESRGLKSIDL